MPDSACVPCRQCWKPREHMGSERRLWSTTRPGTPCWACGSWSRLRSPLGVVRSLGLLCTLDYRQGYTKDSYMGQALRGRNPEFSDGFLRENVSQRICRVFKVPPGGITSWLRSNFPSVSNPTFRFGYSHHLSHSFWALRLLSWWLLKVKRSTTQVGRELGP